MKKCNLAAVVFLAMITFRAAADHVPSDPLGPVAAQARFAASIDLGDFDPYMEILGRLEGDDPEPGYRSLTLGAYYRAHRNLKLGAFYRLQAGALHDDDWIWLAPGWGWRDTAERYENVFILDASPRFLFDFLPGRDWVFMAKSRIFYNTDNGHLTVMVRPGLTRFIFTGRDPFLNLSAAWAFYIPVNFGELPLYEHAPYLSLLYHTKGIVKLELTAAYRNLIWTTSKDVKASADPGYTARTGSWLVGVGLILNLETE